MAYIQLPLTFMEYTQKTQKEAPVRFSFSPGTVTHWQLWILERHFHLPARQVVAKAIAELIERTAVQDGVK